MLWVVVMLSIFVRPARDSLLRHRNRNPLVGDRVRSSMNVEQDALRGALGEGYVSYIQRTKRLLLSIY